ncbi:MAG: response regulator [Phycisphaerae bacterium]|jgi:diguanylate cyclase (GGDEF)-like protein
MTTRILIADDDPAVLRMLERLLHRAGYDVLSAGGGEEAIRLALAEKPSILITDWSMPDMNGVEVCRVLRSLEGIRFTYIIMLTAHAEEERMVEAFEAGADDYLRKPVNPQELLARLHAATRIVQLEADLERQNRSIRQVNAELLAVNRRLEELVRTDPLTGLANRREAMSVLNAIWQQGDARLGLSCMLLDIDHFKSLNDRFGHAFGDQALCETARAMNRLARPEDVVCRIGGEEFLILCPGQSLEATRRAAERIRAEVQALTITCDGQEATITASIGVAAGDATMHKPDDLIRKVDQAMYVAKRLGRNQVRTAEEQPPADRVRVPAPAELATAVARHEAADPSAPPTVLVADDDAGIRAMCRRFLEAGGFGVIEAGDGLEALAKAAELRPDVIVLDAVMPRLDGLECARRLKAHPLTREVPVIMASASDAEADVLAGLEAGVDEYITKPPRRREFLLRVSSMARLFRGKVELMRACDLRDEHARALALLLDYAVALSVTRDMEAILEKTVAVTARLLRCGRVSLMLPDSRREYLAIAKAVGIDPEVVRSLRVPHGEAIAGSVFDSGRPCIVNSPDGAPRDPSRYDTGVFASVPLASHPLVGPDRIMGVLNLTQRAGGRPFSPRELKYIELISALAAAMIDDTLTRRARDEAADSIVIALATLVEYRDNDTRKHMDRVTAFSLILARELQRQRRFTREIDGEFLHDLERAVPLHDIGKVAVPDRVLLKAGTLDAEETLQMRRHAEIGARTIRSVIERVPNVRYLKMAEQITLSHHEFYDGTGYPHQLKGDRIPLAARITALADVYDAITTRRSYKDALSHEAAVAIIREASGTQFDPRVVDAFLARQEEFRLIATELADDHHPTCGSANLAPVEAAEPVSV